MSYLSLMHRMRLLLGMVLAAAALTVLISRNVEEPDLQTAVASALAADNPVIEVALEQYPKQGPAIVVTYGHLPLFQEQLRRFGPQVVPIVAAYQKSFTTADALQLTQEAWQAVHNLLASWHTFVWPFAPPAGGAPQIPGEAADPSEEQTAAEDHAVDMGRLSKEERGLLALFNMDQQGNAFVGQWEITPAGEASRIPSRVVMLEGPELLAGGLTAVERRIFQGQEVEWQSYVEATVDVVALASGFALLRFAKTAGRGMNAVRDAAKIPTLRSDLAVANVLGIKAVRYGLPVGLAVVMIKDPSVFTRYLWVLAKSLGIPGIIGPLIGWGIVVVPLAFLLSWMLLSFRLLRFAGWLLAGTARGCQQLAVRLAVPDRRHL